MSPDHQYLLSADIEKKSWFRGGEFTAACILALEDIFRSSAPQCRRYRSYDSDQASIRANVYVAHDDGLTRM
jgi:hypothetical protein